MTIQFRDRGLVKGETSQYWCDQCGKDVISYMREFHRCKDGDVKRFKKKQGLEIFDKIPCENCTQPFTPNILGQTVCSECRYRGPTTDSS